MKNTPRSWPGGFIVVWTILTICITCLVGCESDQAPDSAIAVSDTPKQMVEGSRFKVDTCGKLPYYGKIVEFMRQSGGNMFAVADWYSPHGYWLKGTGIEIGALCLATEVELRDAISNAEQWSGNGVGAHESYVVDYMPPDLMGPAKDTL
jgi:hypothetical protein